jgi:anion-transporting  ArsA/GET3 family ATPase
MNDDVCLPLLLPRSKFVVSHQSRITISIVAWAVPRLECVAMRVPRLLFVTGKGGVGKTTVAAALGQHAAEHGHRTLIVETATDGRLAHLFGQHVLGAAPRRLRPGLDAVRADARELVEKYFSRLLRFQVLSKRLLASTAFNALTAAAPGITEFLLLEKLLGWIEPGLGHRPGGRRPGYALIIVDGPSTGHALKLLRTPRSLAAMVPGGPLGKAARRVLAFLADHEHTQVLLVSLPEEMSVRETIEAQQVLESDLALRVTRPVMNRVFPRHFSAAEAQVIEQNGDLKGAPVPPLLAAARFAIAYRREAERHVGHLRRALGVSPIVLRQLFTPSLHAAELEVFGRTLWRAVLGEEVAKATSPSTTHPSTGSGQAEHDSRQ